MIDLFVFLVYFLAAYGSMIVLAFFADKFLRHFFNTEILPEEYFKW
tara:strand:+ start:608 stop:745 length:138 start_codon:yes stop_codon:yes gene_type:complete